jgi:hypothetical protein
MPIKPSSKYIKNVIVRLDRTIQNLLKRLDSVLRLDRGIKSWNDKPNKSTYLLDGLIIRDVHCLSIDNTGYL